MITFHLGVIDVPYEDENTTTGDVAEYLEEKYQIMQTFFDRYSNDIADLMTNDMAASLENMMAGAPPARDPLAESMSRIHDLFVAFLDNTEMNGLPGVPTRRALKGISRRFKNKKGPPRPSFIDTGTYQAAMRAWVSGVLNAFPE
ncbi:hypothetical protein FEQ43_06690 [Salmonella enterica]|uniref:Uncharacterized protein n=3 Tax=Salmonella enterica TaxID=28901 RepID=A0A5V7NVN7_SALET|nr:hypothetical protein [Salmonella enterica]EAA8719798.1 hypothetical protein [Salmonella enterica subsp. enterica serovar Pomona]EAP4124682.1 hypothetical protein [Salmonella enterica subsp. enterica serovar Infantis]EAR0342751.1 hypothetical protein [Salmonella enterica subsp. enterica serovar Anatum]EBH8669801.1 hypothetical protein [Salmonella enterica subsp. enterica serovar Saintpaul]EBL4291092.1 hypothetical protein [Salmonella enterica subsp. enterica serovar Rubislaw]EBR3872107.1 hy